MTFAEFITARDSLESIAREASARLKAMSGGGPWGLTPDRVKQAPAWRAAAAEYAAAHEALRRLNGANVKRFAKELRAMRAERRAA